VTGVTSSVLPGLPGASDDPGTGPVVDTLVDGLLGDVVPVPAAVGPAGVVGGDTVARPPVADAVAAHRDHRASWYGDLLGPMRVPAAPVADVVAALLPRDHALPVTLVVPSVPGAVLDPQVDPVAELHAARALLVDDDRIEVVGVELPLPGGPEPAAAARRALAALDVSVPAWFVVPPDVRWLPALDVLAADGAESVALHVGSGADADVAGAAAVLRRAVDLDVAVAATSGELPVVTEDSGCGLLNLLCAVRAALNGASPEEVTAVLACRRPEPLCSAARRMSDADAAVVRAFLPLLTTPSVREAVAELESLSLIAPDAA